MRDWSGWSRMRRTGFFCTERMDGLCYESMDFMDATTVLTHGAEHGFRVLYKYNICPQGSTRARVVLDIGLREPNQFILHNANGRVELVSAVTEATCPCSTCMKGCVRLYLSSMYILASR